MDQPLSAVVRCRKRQQDVAPFEGLSIGIRNGTSRSGRCEEHLTKMELKF